MNCCYGTLATLIKYPNDNKKLSHFKSENELFDKIVSSTGMRQGDKIYRHPATFLLEAADDIAYLFADLEDAVKKDPACLQEIINKIEKEKGKIFTKEFSYDEFKKSIDEFDLNKHEEMPTEDIISTKIMSLRVFFQAYCINKICEEFVNSYDEIMTGNYKKSLCESKNLVNIIGDNGIIRKLCIKYAYQNSEVLKLEIIGKKVLTSISHLEKYYNAYFVNKKNNLEENIFKEIPLLLEIDPSANIFDDLHKYGLEFICEDEDGWGLWESIKPEVVDVGGGLAIDERNNIRLINETSIDLMRKSPEGPAHAKDNVGTSYSTPVVSNLAAILQKEYPQCSPLLYKTLIVHSAKWPDFINPNNLDNEQMLNIIKSYGYGIPNKTNALQNNPYKITFITNGSMKLNVSKLQ